jgi:TetR/AcrR family transcriptional repressor of nem operon
MQTRDQILDSTERLIQAKGFSGFSFQDIAEEVGIKKASIYYHFPAKGDLGRAVVARYRERMRINFDKLPSTAGAEFWSLLNRYLGPMRDFGRATGLACLSGVMGGEFLNLPAAMQDELKAFFVEHEDFLTALLEQGRAAQQFKFQGDARTMARLMFSAIEGALLIKRIKLDDHYVDGLVESFIGQLGGRP